MGGGGGGAGGGGYGARGMEVGEEGDYIPNLTLHCHHQNRDFRIKMGSDAEPL